MIEDEVLYTPQLATIVVDIHKRMADLLDANFGISFLELCVLASMRSHGGELTISEFPQGLTSNSNSVVSAVLKLEEKGLLTKSKHPDDRRVIVMHDTQEGSKVLVDAFDIIFRHLRDTVWKNSSDEDVNEIMHAMPSVPLALGIGAIEINNLCHPVMTTAYLMVIGALLQKWTQVVKEYSGLSLTEFRYLSLLQGRPEALTGTRIAETLFLDKGSVTTITNSLKKKSLVETVKGADNRSVMISLSEKGQVLSALVSAKLNRTTAALYADSTLKVKSMVNELHMRMYSTYVDA